MLKKSKNEEIAYLAGLIDGEGCIIIFPNRKNYSVRLDITQKNLLHLQKIQKIWGGRIQKGIKEEFHLIWSGQNSLSILENCLFYSKFKDQQIGLALLYLKNISPGSGHKLDIESAKNIYKQLKELKKS